jgi:DNA-directed RNA polymerase subunit RPC12/RpoP
MSPGESFIHFGCPRCTAPLKAPADHAGRRQRCPLCHWAVDVPCESRRTDFEEYTFHDSSAPGADTAAEIAFECPVCRTRMTAPEEQVGQQIACPDCRKSVTVPAKHDPRPRKQPVPLEAYALCEDYDPASPPSPRPQYVPVHCGLCGTLMQVALERVGSSVTCPDCGTATVVRPPRPAGSRDTRPTTESYEVREEIGQPPPESVACQEHVGFLCSCGTRLHALVAEVGHELICPDCGRSVTVPSWARRRPKRELTKEINGLDDAAAAAAGESPAPAFPRPQVWLAGRFSAMLDQHGRLPPDRPPPRWPLVSGVFTFPWRNGVWARWLSLSVWAMLIACMGQFGWNMGGGIAGGGIGAIGPAIVSVVFVASAGCLALGWTGVFFINLLVILGDTAAGADNVEHWPDPYAFLDWAGSTLFAIDSLALSLAAGNGLGWLLSRAGLPGGYATVAVPLVLFPVVLLSMLEVNSPWVPLSRTVCRSLVRNWRAWIGFYLEAILLLAASGGMVIAALLPGRLLLAIPAAALTMVASLMIYFRLLGRLAWCCSAPRSSAAAA